MRVWHWWQEMQESYRREFDERAQAQQLRAMRDAFLVLVALLVVGTILCTLVAPSDVRGAVLNQLPVYAAAIAAYVFFLSAGLRGAFTRRRALLFGGVYLVSGLLVAVIMAIAGRDTGEVLGLVAGIVFTAIVVVAVAWRNG